ncbi:hypothetical protein MMAD_21610 [Mycolicibacterium madagascariense]|uniref:Uncharacterized protein n=1 Tax=Mycolicibacterium madagascariense TaxID=212765 RepID=A0A7I7XFB5_9MYCO|nr:hypothetical protein [Mycolicibacterium madagascariense]MCV7015566.1 hypothetical protein [Mycolicibacterium madagascariense]BBZ27866.1 hypothetical protein MMAD_21610 [Mycolicibacterium madagascariense]
MYDQLEQAVLAAAESGAPPRTFDVGPDAAVEFGTGRNPFDGLQITAWDDVATGRCE